MSQQPGTITIPLPDDWHLHVRDGEVLDITVNHSASRCRRAIIMPNLKPPIRTVAEAAEYRQRILQASHYDHYQPLMTLYLTDQTSAEEVRRAVDSEFVHAIKLYPAGATTNSEDGLTAVQNARNALEAMEKLELPLLVHAESTDPGIDVFDREMAFVDSDLAWICSNFPELRIVFEHVSSRYGIEFVETESRRMGGTVTPHHLLLTRNDMLVGGMKPHHYCLPVVKTEEDREALLKACLEKANVFVGTDSAPHPRSRKESHSCAAGIYTAPFFPELYATAFESSFPESAERPEALQDFLIDFLCLRGEKFYRMPLNENARPDLLLKLYRSEQPIPAHYSFGDDELVPLYAGKSIRYTAEIVPNS
jgi:dihydroorotase